MRIVVIGNAKSKELNISDFIPKGVSEIIFERGSTIGALVENYADRLMLPKCGRPIPENILDRLEAYLSLAKKCDCLIIIYENACEELAKAGEQARRSGVRVIEHRLWKE